jgi:hypothetical protein
MTKAHNKSGTGSHNTATRNTKTNRAKKQDTEIYTTPATKSTTN